MIGNFVIEILIFWAVVGVLYLIFKKKAVWIIGKIAMHANLVAVVLYFLLWQTDHLSLPDAMAKIMLHAMVALIIQTLLNIHKKAQVED
jgi:hypothetical protein